MHNSTNIQFFFLFTGCKDKRIAPVLRDIIQTDYFRVVVVDDVDTVEVCGALKVIGRGIESLVGWFVGCLVHQLQWLFL